MNDDWKICQHEFEPFAFGLGEVGVTMFRVEKCVKCGATHHKNHHDNGEVEEMIRAPQEIVIDGECRKSVFLESAS